MRGLAGWNLESSMTSLWKYIQVLSFLYPFIDPSQTNEISRSIVPTLHWIGILYLPLKVKALALHKLRKVQTNKTEFFSHPLLHQTSKRLLLLM